MASRISQIRNGMQPQLQPQPQAQLNQSIDAIRNMMQQLKNTPNANAILLQALENNSNMLPIVNIIRSNGNLENFAKQMAQVNGINISELIQNLLK